MKGFLIDTNVISMLAPSRAEAPSAFLDWLDREDREGRIFLSVVTVHEIEKGVALLEHKGATAKAAALNAWLSGLLAAYDDKIIGFDASAAALAGRLEADAIASGHDPGMADAMIAGIAKAYDLRIVTLNVRHFQAFDADVVSPEFV